MAHVPDPHEPSRSVVSEATSLRLEMLGTNFTYQATGVGHGPGGPAGAAWVPDVVRHGPGRGGFFDGWF